MFRWFTLQNSPKCLSRVPCLAGSLLFFLPLLLPQLVLFSLGLSHAFGPAYHIHSFLRKMLISWGACGHQVAKGIMDSHSHLGKFCRWKAVELFLINVPSLALISSNTLHAPYYEEEISDLWMLRRYIIVHLLVAGPSFLFGETKLNSSRKILGESSSHCLLNLACSQLPFLPILLQFLFRTNND